MEGGEICERCSNHYDRGLQSTDESFVMEIIQNIQKLEQKKQHLSDLITKEVKRYISLHGVIRSLILKLYLTKQVSVQKSSTYESKILQLQDLQSTHRLLMERITKGT